MSDTAKHTRRDLFTKAGLLTGAALTSGAMQAAESPPPASADKKSGFTFCLNTATIRGHHLSLVAEFELAAKAGYKAIEPWVEPIHRYVAEGGSLKDFAKRVVDLGLSIESAIGFPQWIVEDDALRAKGMEQAKKDMDVVAQIGGKRLAAPPAGATKEPLLDLHKVTERYRALLELGDQMGIIPELEVWGFSQNIKHLSDAMFVALSAGHPKACVLADVFHLYKGGSGVEGLRLLSGEALPVLHMNDYPAEPLPDKIDDSFRIFPGDGVAPISRILRTLHDNGGHTVLSLELFNKDYWRQDALKVAQTGLEKMKLAVEKALA